MSPREYWNETDKNVIINGIKKKKSEELESQLIGSRFHSLSLSSFNHDPLKGVIAHWPKLFVKSLVLFLEMARYEVFGSIIVLFRY